jgi:hypothetical protein
MHADYDVVSNEGIELPVYISISDLFDLDFRPLSVNWCNSENGTKNTESSMKNTSVPLEVTST